MDKIIISCHDEAYIYNCVHQFKVIYVLVQMRSLFCGGSGGDSNSGGEDCDSEDGGSDGVNFLLYNIFLLLPVT